MNVLDVTIVVCTYNRAGMLGEALQSLVALETGGRFSYEVLVVDNASTDETAATVEHVARQAGVPVRRVLETQQGIPFARNRGVRDARGEWIAFFDDDQIARRDWLDRLLAMANAKRADCVGGAVRLHLPDEQIARLPTVVRMLLGESVGMDQPCRYSPAVTPGAGNLLIHRRVFEQIGLFDESLVRRGEDTDLFLRLHRAGFEAWYTPEAVIFHMVPDERLNFAYLKKLATFVSEDIPAVDYERWGARLFPLVWGARLAKAAALDVPRLAWSRCRGAQEQVLGARCRLSMAATYCRRAWSMFWTPSNCEEQRANSSTLNHPSRPYAAAEGPQD